MSTDYSDMVRQSPEAALMRALREYREAEQRLVARTQASLGIGENDLVALRYLLWEDLRNAAVGPKALGSYLGLSSASITTLVDRLVARGFVERRQDPDDRRAVILVPTLSDETRSLLERVNRELLAGAARLDRESAARFTTFLRELRTEVDAIDA